MHWKSSITVPDTWSAEYWLPQCDELRSLSQGDQQHTEKIMIFVRSWKGHRWSHLWRDKAFSCSVSPPPKLLTHWVLAVTFWCQNVTTLRIHFKVNTIPFDFVDLSILKSSSKTPNVLQNSPSCDIFPGSGNKGLSFFYRRTNHLSLCLNDILQNCALWKRHK